ncbi:MAG: phosphoenolpyruvate carboxykinase, partial [Candidatus Nanohaloarchaea archaeon]|nr:phosphoenolpyruvate carboxykinase [Candidatus Nanohaloarchaea archaeon]
MIGMDAWHDIDFPDPEDDSNVRYNPSEEELRELAGAVESTTAYGSPSYVSEYRSRSADLTANRRDEEFSAADREDIAAALEEASERELVALDRKVGSDSDNTYTCRYFVPEEYARIAVSLSGLFEPADEDAEPDFKTLQLPDWEGETKIRVDPEAGETYVLGSDYTGEAKKSFLRLFMYEAKQQGGLGLHAGTKRVRMEQDGEMQEVGQLFMGLSGTGKSTLTSHGLWLDDPEYAEMVQDDVCALMPDGAVHGSEGGGLYIKTDSLTAEEQPELYEAATSEDAVLENVAVDDDGEVDFHDTELTRNGRAVVSRDDLPSAADDINLDS